MKFAYLFISLVILYECFNLVKSTEKKKDLEIFSDTQFLKERRSVNEDKLAPYNSIVGIASSNVIAYSNGNDSYYSNENSYLYGVYMGLKWQCVEYARRWTFLRKSSIFESVEGANDMWTQLTHVQRYLDEKNFPLKKHANGNQNPPTNESYLIYPIQRDMPFGHVAVIVDVLPNAIRIAEQNFYFNYWPKNYSREIPYRYKNGLYYIEDEYEVYGWIEIDDQQELQPLEVSTVESIRAKLQLTIDLPSSSPSSIRTYYYLLSFFLVLFFSIIL